ncbi:MAG TPA: 16S rRNA (guanine(966)-N(2))-methyltransferase RsmD [Microbacteriaceae bacterium]|nr:16S rRNA (guanine(966)-N(2))-methyltransferase RsmD [Microbacteriaceae bacterium]
MSLLEGGNSTIANMTRIISGKARSLTLRVPKSGTRPTSDRVREAMFSTLESWDAIEDARVLDLFAGTGALGIEAASRGASEVLLLEKHAPAAEILKKNVQAALKMLSQNSREPDATSGHPTSTLLKVLRASATTFFADKEETATWDLVFIDPPYEFKDASLASLLEDLVPHLRQNAVVMVERSSRNSAPVWPEGLQEIKQKRYGETTLWWAELE